MTDTNQTRRRAAVNLIAFTDVIGNPFSIDDTEGNYGAMKHRSLLSATRNNFGEGAATVNPVRPNAIEFCVDVEAVIMDVLGDDPKLLAAFIDTYVTGTEESVKNTTITRDERSYIEQRMGRLFLARGISPVINYFTTIKRTRRP